MKTLGQAALDLPWIAPSVASLMTLARSPTTSSWAQLRNDPGFLLLTARSSGASVRRAPVDLDVELLEAILNHLQSPVNGFVDWTLPGPDVVYRTAYRQALLCCRLAEKFDCNIQDAWIAGFLAPLGWLAVAAANPQRVRQDLAELGKSADVSHWQQKAWGHDHTAIARRLSRCWRLPSWLTAVLGHLGLHVTIAERLGAQPEIFQLVQLAVLLLQNREPGLRLPVGSTLPELLAAFHANADDVEAVADAVLKTDLPTQKWEAPGTQPLLEDYLRLALDQRRRNDSAWIERLQSDLDRLQDALVAQCSDDQRRLQAMKLSAVAELAAGAGHEINNPLAVISGQAQYVLKQLEWLDGPAEEIENVGEYLANLRATIVPSLQKIIGQTQRVHTILTDLMQFARPSAAKPQTLSVRKLTRDVCEALQSEALDRKVELTRVDPVLELWVEADPAQMRVALGALLRNGIQAAPPGGRVGLRVETAALGTIDLIVEDDGPGPPPNGREHLFDPFYCGRSAGRGRGMGLPTAWRLARQQGGDVRFEGVLQGLTRFVLSLPMSPAPPTPFANGNGHAQEANGHVHPLETHS